MIVIKRNNETKEAYNLSKVINAANKAFVELGYEEKGYELAKRLNESNFKNKKEITIKEIQDMVELSLMDLGYHDVAKAYIEYRVRRDIRRESIREVYYTSEFLSDEFLSQYPDYPEIMSPISQFTYLRTYSRDIPELGRRETFKETVIRTVDYNVGLDTRPRTKVIKDQLIEEAEELFDMHFKLRGFLSGRALFTGGSSASQKYPLSLFNCSYVEPTKIDDFYDILYLLSVGAGVGYRVTWDVVDQLPLFRSNVSIDVQEFKPKPKRLRLENTVIVDAEDEVYITVGDSKEGWAEAVREFIRFHTVDYNYKTIHLNFDSVRPSGEMLLTFGGYASGHGPLQKALELMNEVIVGDYKDSHGNVLTKAMVDGKARPIHIMHLANLIANAIVVGGRLTN